MRSSIASKKSPTNVRTKLVLGVSPIRLSLRGLVSRPRQGTRGEREANRAKPVSAVSHRTARPAGPLGPSSRVEGASLKLGRGADGSPSADHMCHVTGVVDTFLRRTIRRRAAAGRRVPNRVQFPAAVPVISLVSQRRSTSPND